MFGLNKAFRITGSDNGKVTFHPINNMDKVMLDDLIGYEIQKKKLVENTEVLYRAEKPTMRCYSATAVRVNQRVSRRLSMNTTTRVCA